MKQALLSTGDQSRRKRPGITLRTALYHFTQTWAAVEYDLSASSLAISSPSGASFMYERSFLKTRSGNGTVNRIT
jgi:hypothetical protein